MKMLKKRPYVLLFPILILVGIIAIPWSQFAIGSRANNVDFSSERMSKDRYEPTKSRMPLVYEVAKKFGRKEKLRLLIGLPLTFETLSIIDAIRGEFEVVVIPQSSGPSNSTQTGVFEHLDRWGIRYFTTADEESRIKALSMKPHVVVDCSYMLGEVALKHGLLSDETILIEDTKTGENRLESLRSEFGTPSRYVVLDNSYYKRLYENSTGIGYSVVGAIMSMGLFLPRYKVGVVGFGYVGSGLAKYLRDIGANDIFVSEIDPKRIAMAKKAGFKTVPLQELLEKSDIVITATGKTNVIKRSDLASLNKRIVLANAGGEEEWVRSELFASEAPIKIHEDIKKYVVGLSEIWELGEGNSLNLVREISVTEFLDITFAQLVFGLFNLDRVAISGKTEVSKFETPEFKNLVVKMYGKPTGIYGMEMQ